VKLYPCLDLPYTVTRKWKEEGKWKPIAENDFPSFLELLRHALARVPPWTRINRVQRDFPEAMEKNGYLGFVSDNIKSNLQQYVVQELKKHNQKCYDIRSREIKNSFPPDFADRAKLYIRCYRANSGTEFFISVEYPHRKAQSADDNILMGLCRLRFSDYDIQRIVHKQKIGRTGKFHLLPTFQERCVAKIRELHVYGNINMVQKEMGKAQSQHSGVGTFLMAVAERIALCYGFEELAVISGIGVRNYYRRLGYELNGQDGEYMTKLIGYNLSKRYPNKPHIKKQCNPNPYCDQSELELKTKCTPTYNLLPLQLFHHKFSDDDVIIPVSCMFIPRYYLKIVPSFEKLTTRWLLPPVKSNSWFKIFPYMNIQNGEAELAVIDTSVKTAWYKSEYLLSGVAVAFALSFVAVRRLR